MKLAKVMTIAFIAVFSLLSTGVIVGETVIENTHVSLTITITDAYYTALDADGVEDDIIVKFNLDVMDIIIIDNNRPQKFILHFTLTLPSGFAYHYTYKVIADRNAHYELTVEFLNHGTEPGWYLIEITGILTSNDPELEASGTESLYFDPPGSSGPTDPAIRIY